MRSWGGNGTVPPPDEISQYFLRQASDYSTNVCGYAPRLQSLHTKMDIHFSGIRFFQPDLVSD
mgnify:CR=1 FL=1